MTENVLVPVDGNIYPENRYTKLNDHDDDFPYHYIPNHYTFHFLLLKFKIVVRIEFFAQLINIKFFHSTSSNLSPTHHSKSNLLKRNDRERIRGTG